MLATKIIITKEEIEVEPDREYLFTKMPDYTKMLDMNQAPAESFVAYESEKFIPKLVYGADRVKRCYLVKKDDAGLFNELLEINLEEFRKIEDDAANKGYGLGIIKGTSRECERIKKLSWWKRLFNQF